MLGQDLGELVNGLRFVDIKVENVSQGITQSIRRVCFHVSHEVD